MATGKIEYAPDYKSRKARRYPDMTDIFAGMKRRDEQRRLERAVVEAAKAWFHIGASTATDDIKTDARCSLSARVGELEAFEASHAIGQKDRDQSQ